MTEISGKLLVVDDNEMNRDMLGRRLSRRGHSILTDENGQQALDLIGQESFDVVQSPGVSTRAWRGIPFKYPISRPLANKEVTSASFAGMSRHFDRLVWPAPAPQKTVAIIIIR